MKRYIPIIICLVFTLVLFNKPINCNNITNSTISPFKVFLRGTDPIRARFPIIEYDNTVGYSIYKTEQVNKDINKPVYRLFLDENNKPVKVHYADPNYFTNLFTTFFYGNETYFEGSVHLKSISLTFYFPKRMDYPNEKVSYCTIIYFNNLNNQKSKKIFAEENKYSINSGSICYIDDLYQIEWQELTTNGFYISRREAINPDLLSSFYEIPGLIHLLPNGYKYYRNRSKGYIHFKRNTNEYTVNGRQFNMPNKITTIKGKSMVEFFLLTSLLNCEYYHSKDVIRSQGIYIAQRLLKNTSKDSLYLVSLGVSIDSDVYYIDNVKNLFSNKTYLAKDNSASDLMVPLKEVCEALKAKVIYRPLDGSILIARFFEDQ